MVKYSNRGPEKRHLRNAAAMLMSLSRSLNVWLDTFIWKCYHSSAQYAMMLRSKKTSNVKRVVKQHGWVISVLTIMQPDRGGHGVSTPMEGTLCSADVGSTSESHCPPFNCQILDTLRWKDQRTVRQIAIWTNPRVHKHHIRHFKFPTFSLCIRTDMLFQIKCFTYFNCL